MDVIANDHYLDHRLGDPVAELSFAADLTRGLAGGRPWMLMEQSTGAVNWQPYNLAKTPGQMLRNSLTHVARGADAVCFFQWRASAQGAEKFHSAMLPHAGTDTAVWREVLDLSATLDPAGRGRRHDRRGRHGDPVQLGVLVGHRHRGPALARRSATSTRCTPPTGRCGSSASPPTSSLPAPT